MTTKIRKRRDMKRPFFIIPLAHACFVVPCDFRFLPTKLRYPGKRSGAGNLIYCVIFYKRVFREFCSWGVGRLGVVVVGWGGVVVGWDGGGRDILYGCNCMLMALSSAYHTCCARPTECVYGYTVQSFLAVWVYEYSNILGPLRANMSTQSRVPLIHEGEHTAHANMLEFEYNCGLAKSLLWVRRVPLPFDTIPIIRRETIAVPLISFPPSVTVRARFWTGREEGGGVDAGY